MSQSERSKIKKKLYSYFVRFLIFFKLKNEEWKMESNAYFRRNTNFRSLLVSVRDILLSVGFDVKRCEVSLAGTS